MDRPPSQQMAMAPLSARERQPWARGNGVSVLGSAGQGGAASAVAALDRTGGSAAVKSLSMAGGVSASVGSRPGTSSGVKKPLAESKAAKFAKEESTEALPYGCSSDMSVVADQLNKNRLKESRDKGYVSANAGEEECPHTYHAERVLGRTHYADCRAAGSGQDAPRAEAKCLEAGSGSFGVVYEAKVVETGETVAIKKVLQDSRYKNRELQIMRELRHANIVGLIHAFYTPGEKPNESYLHVVMEFCSETVHQIMKHYTKQRQQVPPVFVSLYTYQMLRGVAYMHAVSICHRDIKPQNLLVEGKTHALKICDFGSAKRLSKDEPNVAYICSRFYRAPELIFGATDYSTIVDMWGVGCVTAELILGQVLFPGNSGIDQLMEIIKVLGTPTRDDLMAMNPNYQEYKFPMIRSQGWQKVFRSRASPDAVDCLSRLLQYNPKLRPTGLEACTHAWFDELRAKDFCICGRKPLPDGLFWFSKEELGLMDDAMKAKLVPAWVTVEQGGRWSLPRDETTRARRGSAGASTSNNGTGSLAAANGGQQQRHTL